MSLLKIINNLWCFVQDVMKLGMSKFHIHSLLHRFLNANRIIVHEKQTACYFSAKFSALVVKIHTNKILKTWHYQLKPKKLSVMSEIHKICSQLRLFWTSLFFYFILDSADQNTQQTKKLWHFLPDVRNLKCIATPLNLNKLCQPHSPATSEAPQLSTSSAKPHILVLFLVCRKLSADQSSSSLQLSCCLLLCRIG